MLSAYTNWLIRFRWASIFLTVIVVIALASGGRFLSFTNDYTAFFGDNNPQLQAFEDLQDTYAKNDSVLIMLEPADGEVFTPRTLQAIAELTENAWQTPYSSRVDSITNYQYTTAEEDDLLVEDLVEDPQGIGASEMGRLKAIALDQPLLVNRLLSPEANVTGININFQLPGNDGTVESTEIIDFLNAQLQRHAEKYPEIKTYKTGVIVMNTAFPEASFNDMRTLIPAAFAIILLGFLLFTRSIWGTLASIVVMLMSIVAAMGTAGWLGIVLTPPSATAPTLILTLAVADCVHFLVTMFQQMRAGNDKNSAIKESVRVNLNPIFLTSLTTGIGFLSMNFSDSPPFHDLGNITAIGVFYAFVLSTFFLPALMSILPLSAAKKATTKVTVMNRVASFVIAQHKALFWVVGALIVLLIAMAPRNQLNDVFVHYFDKSIPFRAETDHISENLTGMYFVDYSIDSKANSGINKPDYLNQLASFEGWLKQQPEVLHVNAISETFRRLNKNMHGDDQSYYRIPENQELAAQYLLIYEMSLPYGLDLNNQINIDKSATRLTATLKTLSTKQTVALEHKVTEWMGQNTPDLITAGASPTIMFTHISKRNINSMLSGTTIALILISLVLVVALRSVKYGLISLVPNLVPAGMAFGLWAVFVGEIGLAVSVVAAMTLGIVVDDTIHFLSKYTRARRERGMNTEDAIRYAFNTVGVALFITTVILTSGFMIIAQSTFQVNAHMGLLTAITICLALFIDFFFLPPMLMKLDRDDKTASSVATALPGTA